MIKDSGKIYICKECCKEYKTSRTIKGKIFCSKKCFWKFRKNKKFPHSAKWEENRLRELKKNAWKLKGLTPPNKGKKTGKFIKCRKCNSEIYKTASLLNKNNFCCRKCCYDWNRGKNTYNYKGSKNNSKKHEWIRKNSFEYKKWRKDVLTRDSYKCRLCGSAERLEVHHIIPFSQCPKLVVLEMNGMTICHNCHKKTDSYGKNYSKNNTSFNDSLILIFTIPHRFHRYETCGDYAWTKDNVLVIFVSKLGNINYEYLVSFHEFIEASLIKKRGIKEEDINNFDIMFEEERKKGLWKKEECGDDPRSPYRAEHEMATIMEKILAKELKINWSSYEKCINEL